MNFFFTTIFLALLPYTATQWQYFLCIPFSFPIIPFPFYPQITSPSYPSINPCVNGQCPTGYGCYNSQCVPVSNNYGPCINNQCTMGFCYNDQCVG